MTPKQIAYDLMCEHPQQFFNHDSCLFYLFTAYCFHDFDYEWKNGEIVNKKHNDKPIETFEDAVNCYFNRNLTTENICSFPLKILLYNVKRNIFKLYNIKNYMESSLDDFFKNTSIEDFGRLHKNCLIYNLPNEMTKEWKEICVSFVSHMEKYFSNVYCNNDIISEIKQKLSIVNVI